MNFFHTQKLFLITIISVFAVCITGCSSDKDNDPDQEQKAQEQEMYEKYVTAEVQNVLETLEMKINRGINPPNIEGHFLFFPNCKKSTIPQDSYLGRTTADYYLSLFGQQANQIKFLGYEITQPMYEHTADGTFITGEGDKFTIYFEEKVKSGAYLMTVLSLMSGEVARGDDGKIVGFNNFQYVFYMKDNVGAPNMMSNNSARLYESKNGAVINAITKEAFDKVATNFPKTGRMEAVDAVDIVGSIFSIVE